MSFVVVFGSLLIGSSGKSASAHVPHVLIVASDCRHCLPALFTLLYQQRVLAFKLPPRWEKLWRGLWFYFEGSSASSLVFRIGSLRCLFRDPAYILRHTHSQRVGGRRRTIFCPLVLCSPPSLACRITTVLDSIPFRGVVLLSRSWSDPWLSWKKFLVFFLSDI